MRYAIILFFLFGIQLMADEVTGEDSGPNSQLILIKEGDTISYPTDAKPVEVEALENLHYSCTIMPGDTFKISYITDYNDGRSDISIEKLAGAPGDQEICHIGSWIQGIKGVNHKIKTKEGLPATVTKFFYPFVFDPDNLKNAQIRKNYERENHPSDVETILLRENDIIVYPLSAEAIEIEVDFEGVDFNCTVVPGDSFEVRARTIAYYKNGNARLIIDKVGGKPGDQETCPLGLRIESKIKNCKLIRTETGIPDALSCRDSLKNFLGSQEEEETQELLKNFFRGIFDW